MMATGVRPGRGQRGSVLLVSLIFIFIITLLGFALFNLGVVESRLVRTSETDTRVFEIAQTGVERALAALRQTINAEGSWASGLSAICDGGTHRGCSDAAFHPAATSYLSNFTFDGGTYAVEFMQATAESLSVPCTPDPGATSDVDAAKKICKDLMFVRATGTLTNSPDGYSRNRSIQLLAKAAVGSCLICGGITAHAPTGQPINGNVKIAGSIHITGLDGTASLSLGGGAGQSNSYAKLDDLTSLQRLAPLPLVCPVGRSCSGSSGLVESLGATLKVAQPVNTPAVTLSGGASLGQSGDQTYSADATRTGKGPLDGILVADGCTMPCSDNFTGVSLNSNTFVDDNNITKPYPGTPPTFPRLTDPWDVGGVHYDHFACPQGSSCTAPGTPSTAEFFVSRAANAMTNPNTALRDSLGFTSGLTDATLPFEVPVTFVNLSGATVNGKVCWDRSKPTLPAGVSTPPAGLPRRTLEFGVPDCNTPTPPSNPMLLYFPSSTPATTGFNVQRAGGPTDYNFRGAAIVVTNGLVQIEEIWQSCQTTGAGTPCQGHLFTRDASLTVLTTGDMNLGKSTSNVARIMGLFYAAGTFASQRQTNIVGSITAFRLCFAGGSAPCSSGGNVPSFFEVLPDANNLITTISSGARFTVVSVARFWVECKRAPGTDLPSGLCDYRP